MRTLHRSEIEFKYPIALCVSDECWESIVRWQKKYYGAALALPPGPLPELEDAEAIAKIMSQAPEQSEHLRV